MLDASAPPRGDREGRCIGHAERPLRRVVHQEAEHSCLQARIIRFQSKTNNRPAEVDAGDQGRTADKSSSRGKSGFW